MRLLFAGTPDVAAVSLQALLASTHEVAAILTRPDAASGRGRKVVSSPVASLAQQHGIPLLQPSSLRTDEALADIRAVGAECAAVVAYGAIIPVPVLELLPHGWINLHFSLLPSWRGAAPAQRAIWHGDDVTGACTFRIEEGLDTGPIYGCLTETIGTHDTAGDLLARLAVSGAGLLVETMDGIERGTLQPVPQSGEVSVAPKLTVDDARIAWDLPAVAVDRRIRACTPAPGAWTLCRGERLGIGAVTPLPQEPFRPAGTIAVGKRDVIVGTATSPVRLGLVRPAGKKEMPAADWARGVRLSDEDVLA